MNTPDFDHIQSKMDRHATHVIQLTKMSVAERLAYLDCIEQQMERDWRLQDDPVESFRRQ